MGGGLLELQHIGNEEAYFIHNPQITFFKSVYRRFTNFALESIRNEFENSSIIQPTTEKRINAKISRSGDLIKHISLVIELPALQCTNEYAVQWIPNIGCSIIHTVDFMIEAQIIDRITGEWLYLYYQLYASPEERESFLQMVNHPTYLLSDAQKEAGVYIIPKRILTIPIPFWFSKTTGSALPIIALKKNQLHVQLTFNALEKLFIVRDKTVPNSPWVSPKTVGVTLDTFSVDDSVFTTTGTMDVKAELSVMYVFIDEHERHRILESNIVQTITNTQYVRAIKLERNSNTIPLQVKHPMKEIVWVLQRDDVSERNDWYNFTNFEDSSQTEIESILLNTDPTVITSANQKSILNKAGILLNKNVRLEMKSASYFAELQPHIFLKHKIQDGVFLYSFGLNPANFDQPSGTCNASAFNYIDLVADIVTAPSHTFYNLYAFVVTYNQLRIGGGFGGLQFS